MNEIMIMGYLGQDPEMQTLSNGMEKCRFTVGVSRQVKKDAPKKTDWFNCDAWGATGAFVKNWFRKGSGIIVRGRMESSKSEKDGKIYWSLNADKVFFPVKSGNDHPAEPAPEIDAGSGMEVVNTDEMPF
jgi:single-strand DNA-binding protein